MLITFNPVTLTLLLISFNFQFITTLFVNVSQGTNQLTRKGFTNLFQFSIYNYFICKRISGYKPVDPQGVYKSVSIFNL